MHEGHTLYEDLTRQANRIGLKAIEARAVGMTAEADRLQAQIDEIISFRDMLPIEEAY